MLPVLFTLPTGQPVYSYGVLLGLAVVLGFQLTTRRAGPDRGVSVDRAGNAFLLSVVAGLVGARLSYVAVNPALLAEGEISWWDLQSGGLLGVGGWLAGALAATLYLKSKHTSVLSFADAAAPAAGLFLVCGRLGSYLYGSDFGTKLSETAPAIVQRLGTFPLWQHKDLYGPPVLAYHVERYYLPRDATASLPVHPVQLYEVAFGLVLLLWAWTKGRSASDRPGAVALPICLTFAIGRFLLGYLRADPDRGMMFGFSVTQIGCLALAALSLLGLMQARKLVQAAQPPVDALR